MELACSLRAIAGTEGPSAHRHEAVGRPTPSVLRGREETPHACPLHACGREGDRLRVSSWTGR